MLVQVFSNMTRNNMLRSFWTCVDHYLGRGSYLWIKPLLAPYQEDTHLAYAKNCRRSSGLKFGGSTRGADIRCCCSISRTMKKISPKGKFRSGLRYVHEISAAAQE